MTTITMNDVRRALKRAGGSILGGVVPRHEARSPRVCNL